MRLARIRVQNFRCFRDSGWVDISPTVTPVVGKNESGKTTLLQVLGQASSKVAFSRLTDWPVSVRSELYTPDLPVVTLEFDLSGLDLTKTPLAEFSPTPTTMTVTRHYSGRRTFDLVGLLTPSLPRELRAQLTSPPDETNLPEGILPALKNAQSSLGENWKRQAETVSALLQIAMTVAPDHAYTLALRKSAASLSGMVKVAAAYDWAFELPVDLKYFDTYETVPGLINLSEWSSNKTSEEHTLFGLLCDLAGLDIDRVAELDPSLPAAARERRQMVREASVRLTGKVARLYTQRVFETTFEVDGDTLTVLVKDNLESEAIPLDQRSAGFRWFYSFYVLFTARSEGMLKDCILLLDEPGTRLHGRAQEDLARVMQELAATNQIIFTTHSPFLLVPDFLDDVLAVEESDGGSRIRQSIWSPERDTIFPIHSALGFEMASLYFGRNNLTVVEGQSDYYILEGMRAAVMGAGRADPCPGMAFIPAGGASRVQSVVTVCLEMAREVRALFDADAEGRAQRDTLVRNRLVPDKAVTFTHLDAEVNRTIEDVIGDDIYKQVARESYADRGSEKVRVQAGKDGIVARVERAFALAAVPLNKVAVGRRFRERVVAGDLVITGDHIDRYEELLMRIAALAGAGR